MSKQRFFGGLLGANPVRDGSFTHVVPGGDPKLDPTRIHTGVSEPSGDLALTKVNGANTGWGLGQINAPIGTGDKKYFEVWMRNFVDGKGFVGVCTNTHAVNSSLGASSGTSIGYYGQLGQVKCNGANIYQNITWDADIVSCAVDFNAGKVWFAVNGSWITGNPSTGSGGFSYSTATTLAAASEVFLCVSLQEDTGTMDINPGTNGTFNGQKTAQGNTDANGEGDFFYAVPTGFTMVKVPSTSTARTTSNVGVVSLDEAGPEANGDRNLTQLNWGGIRGRSALGVQASAPSLDLNFDGTASSFTRATTNPTASKTNGDELATDIVSCSRSSIATFMGSNGLIQTAATHTPRIEYDTSGNPLGLLVEEARTNYVLRSIALNNSVWQVTPTTVDTNAHTAPDGSSAADRVNVNTNGFIYQTVSGLTPNTEYTASWFIKPDSATAFVYGFYNQTGTSWITRAQYDPTTGEDFGNGWYRFSVNVTTPSGSTSVRVYPLRHDAGSGQIAGADGSSYVWGVQLEEGPAATSVITTFGQTRTRSGDEITVAASSFGVDPADATFAVDFSVSSASNATSAARIYALHGGTFDDRNMLLYVDQNASQVKTQWIDGGLGATGIVASASSYPVQYTFAQRRNGTSGDFAVDGSLGTSATITEGSVQPTELSIGHKWNGGAQMNGHIRRLIYWPRALSNAQLAAYSSDLAFAGEGGLKKTGILSLNEAIMSSYAP